MRNCLFLISLALSSAACSDSAQHTAVAERAANDALIPPDAPEVPEADQSQGVSFEDNASRDGGNRTFAYSWPAEVSRIPELAVRFAKERDSDLAEQKATWDRNLADAPDDCVSCRGLGQEVEWKVVADLPDFLSLSADVYVYTGGAHGMYGMNSLVWDKRSKRAFDGVDMFVSSVALDNALGASLCDTLDEERAERRGGPIVRDGEWSTDCPTVSDSTVLIGSSNGQTFDRIAIYFGPYTAGSFAEGAYELNFPVTASIIDAVKPEFSSAFSVKR